MSTSTDEAIEAADAMPLVLQYKDRHYSSLLFRLVEPECKKAETPLQRVAQAARERGKQQPKVERDLYDQFEVESSMSSARSEAADDMDVETAHDHRDWKSGQRPWNDSEQSASTNTLLEAMEQPSVTHDEKMQLNDIIEHGGYRKKELAAFITTPIVGMARQDKERLMRANLDDEQVLAAWQRELRAASRGRRNSSMARRASVRKWECLQYGRRAGVAGVSLGAIKQRDAEQQYGTANERRTASQHQPTHSTFPTNPTRRRHCQSTT